MPHRVLAEAGKKSIGAIVAVQKRRDTGERRRAGAGSRRVGGSRARGTCFSVQLPAMTIPRNGTPQSPMHPVHDKTDQNNTCTCTSVKTKRSLTARRSEMVNGRHSYSAFIQSAVQLMPLIQPHTHTPTVIGCHARYQPARQEQLRVRGLAQGHSTTPRVGSNRQPSDCQTTALTTRATPPPSRRVPSGTEAYASYGGNVTAAKRALVKQ